MFAAGAVGSQLSAASAALGCLATSAFTSFHVFSPAQGHTPGWKSLSLLLPSEVFGLGWWPSVCKSKEGTFLWFSAARQSFLKRSALWLMSFGFAHDKNPNISGLGKNGDWLAQRMQVNVEQPNHGKGRGLLWRFTLSLLSLIPSEHWLCFFFEKPSSSFHVPETWHPVCSSYTSTMEKALPFVSCTPCSEILGKDPDWSSSGQVLTYTPQLWMWIVRENRTWRLEPHDLIGGRTSFLADIVSHIMCPIYIDIIFIRSLTKHLS